MKKKFTGRFIDENGEEITRQGEYSSQEDAEKYIREQGWKVIEWTEGAVCPNCQTGIGSGLITIVRSYGKEKTDAINALLNRTAKGYCTKCFEGFSGKIKEKQREAKEFLAPRMRNIPIASVHCPLRWDYDVLGIVTGQIVLGTGLVAEVFSDFTDFFGEKSATYQKKIAFGEEFCFKELRRKTIANGGNAVIGVDIDYGEAGGAKGMLMVAMTGTAIKLKNYKDVLVSEQSKVLDEIQEKISFFSLLSALKSS